MQKTALVFTAALCLVACDQPEVTLNLIERRSSAQSGSANLFDKGDDFEVVIATSGGTDNNDQPTFINTGLCSPLGLFSGVPLETLEPVHQGESVTFVQGRRLSDLAGGAYHIDVQNSADPQFVNACGDIP